MRTSASMNTVRVTPISKDDDAELTSIDGASLLEHFHAYATSISNGPGLSDPLKGHYLKVKSVEGRGNCVLLETESGPFGESATTYDTATGRVVRRNKSSEAYARISRSILFLAPGSKFAIFVKEHKHGIPTGWMLFEEFKHRLTTAVDGFYLPTETVQEDVSWKELANLEEVTVVQHHSPLNISSGTDKERKNETVLGRLAYTALPPKGVKYFAKEVLAGIFSGATNPGTFVGIRATKKGELEGNANPESTVLVKLSRDGQSKTFELGSEGTPMVRELLTDDGEQPLGFEEFYRKSVEMVGDIYKREGYTFKRTDYKGAWSPTAEVPVWPNQIPVPEENDG